MPVHDIDNQPILGIGLPFELLANQCSDPGACAIRTDQILGANGMRLTILIPYGGDDAIRLLDQTLKLEATKTGH
ncbi:hypothetical protein D3C76_1151550 [compost metagenome]